MTDRKLIVLTIVIISLFAISAVNAADNVTADVVGVENQSVDVICDMDDNLTISQEGLSKNSQDENDLNISDSMDNAVLEKNNGSEKKSESPLYGIVDIGANSMELEIFKIKDNGKPKAVFSLSEKSVTAIYTVNNNLTQKGIDKLVSILKDYNDVMDLLKVKTKFVFATASLRKIDNSAEVIATVKKKVGLDINLISGEKEAQTSFNAVKDTDLTTDKGIVIDLGGGSCEVIDFINKTVITSESMPIGVNSCYLEYVNGLFPNILEAKEIENRVLSELKKLVVTNDTQRNDLFGIGGSIKTIKKVLIYLEWIDEDAEYIPVSMLDDLLEEFSQPTKETYLNILNVKAERINTFLPGLIVAKTVAHYFNVTNLHVCKNGVRYGILLEILANESHNSTDKQNISLDVNDIDIACDENAEISIVLPKNATGTITVKIDKNAYSSSLYNGCCLIVFPKLESGNYSAEISYSGDDSYLSNKTEFSIHVKSALLNAYDMTRAQNSDYDYQIKLTDENGNAISNKLISFKIMSNQYYAITNDEGIANIRLNLNVGTYEVFVSSEIAGNSTRTLKIVKRITNNKNLNVYYTSNAVYKVRIIGDDGHPEIGGKNVKVYIDNKLKNIKTDKDGFIKVTIDKNFNVGTHTIKVQYKGVAVKNNVVVKHLVSLKSVTVKKSAKKLVLTASLAKVKGKYLNKKTVFFKFNGKTYKATTNAKGVAKATIKSNVLKNLKVGKKVIYQAMYLKDIVKKTAIIKK